MRFAVCEFVKNFYDNNEVENKFCVSVKVLKIAKIPKKNSKICI